MTTQIVGMAENDTHIKPVKADYGDALKLARRMYAAVGICIQHPGDRHIAEHELAGILYNDVPASALKAALR